MNILIRNLPRFVTEREMLQLFLPFGKVRAHNLVTEPVSGKSKGFGFVDMPDRDEAIAAITALDSTMVGEQKIRVKVTAQKYEAPAKRPERARAPGTERRPYSGENRTAQQPIRRTGRGPATPYRSESRDGTGATWTRTREAAGSSRPARTPDRSSTQPERSGNQAGTGATWTRSRAAAGSSRPARTPDRGSAQPERSESQAGTGATWTRSRTAAGTSRPTRTPDRGSVQPARSEGNYHTRPKTTASREAAKPFWKERTGNERPPKREGNAAEERPKSGGAAGAKPYKPARRKKK